MQFSVVIPVYNEAENILPLINEVDAALTAEGNYEIIVVNDGSEDDTSTRLADARKKFSRLRVMQHEKRCGQSAALATGVKVAQSSLIVTLDGDGQNDPADIPVFLQQYVIENTRQLLLVGHRVERKATWLKRASSGVANAVRGLLLGDATPDTGCGLKVFARDLFLELPEFDHMHRFLPALMQRAGAQILSLPVNDRPRTRGISKYGVNNRLWVGLIDMLGVIWLKRRNQRPRVIEIK